MLFNPDDELLSLPIPLFDGIPGGQMLRIWISGLNRFNRKRGCIYDKIPNFVIARLHAVVIQALMVAGLRLFDQL